MVIVVGMVDIRRATKTTINTKTTAPTIPPQSIQIDPFFLIMVKAVVRLVNIIVVLVLHLGFFLMVGMVVVVVLVVL